MHIPIPIPLRLSTLLLAMGLVVRQPSVKHLCNTINKAACGIPTSSRVYDRTSQTLWHAACRTSLILHVFLFPRSHHVVPLHRHCTWHQPSSVCIKTSSTPRRLSSSYQRLQIIFYRSHRFAYPPLDLFSFPDFRKSGWLGQTGWMKLSIGKQECLGVKL